MFYDSNDIQLSTETKEVMNEDTAAKYRALGWEVFEINGNDAAQIRKAIEQAKAVKGKPALIIGKCIMGKGALTEDGSSYERNCKTHGAPLGGDAYKKTITNLGGDAENPFVIFDDVKELYARRAEELKKIVAERKAEEAAWAQANPEKAAAQAEWFSGKAPKVDWTKVQQKSGDATRNASAAVLSVLAEQVPNMICASADLSNSDKTDGFLKKTHALKAGDFSGAFFQAGVAELTMACCCIGMALHGGVIPACGTFFVFSDYMKPAVRMAALMELPVKFIWTHDAFRVGEDGPTHEPVEQEAQIRLMEKLKNHHGKNSTLVLRPADAQETTAAWRLAMENMKTPTALILSRQNIQNLPEGNDYEQARKGRESRCHPARQRFGSQHPRGRNRTPAQGRREGAHRQRSLRGRVPQPAHCLPAKRCACRSQSVRSDCRSARQPAGLPHRCRSGEQGMGPGELRILRSLQSARRETPLHSRQRV